MSPGVTLAWGRVWTRAVIVPAWRRAAAVWIGTGIFGGVLFGPTGLHPRTITTLALRDPAFGVALALAWALVFLPIARDLVRADAARYLRSLPAPRWLPALLGAIALVALQLPWLLVWVVGEGARGLGVVAACSVGIAAAASWRPGSPHAGWPAWRDGAPALRAIYVRALGRRAGDALLRGAGLSLIAGGTAGLFVRNNGLADARAAVVGGSVLAVMLIPAQLGALRVLADAHRASRWLASSLGLASSSRAAALALVIAGVYLAAGAIGVGAALLVVGADGSTAGWLAATAACLAIGTALGVTRVIVMAEDAPTLPVRVVVGAILASAIAMLCLGVLDVPAALIAMPTVGVWALWTARS